IKNLKNDIQIARQKYVIPFTKSQAKALETPINAKENQNNEISTIKESVSESQEKLYVNNDPASSLDLINSKEQSETVISQDAVKENTNEAATIEEAPTVDINEVATTEEATTVDINEVAATEEATTVDVNEVAATEEAPTVDVNEVVSTEEAPTVDVNEVVSTEEAPTVDVNEVAATEEAPTVDVNEVAATEEAPTVDVNEVASTEEAPTVDVNEVAATEEVPKVDMNELATKEEEPVTEKTQIDNGEDQVKKTELELLEERGEDNLSDEEVDRMYELRLLRSQKKMNNELREQEQEVIKKADDEIAHLKTLLKPKPKKLPKGFVE
ncbi:hypothetical protein N9Y50_07060, partial [Alphaproteobacteria bacterium]|nr:hypothetical protein [Alphaproteobacteria bacterium]